MNRCLDLRNVDVLALAGPPLVIEGGQQSGGNELWRSEISVRRERSGRWAVGPACQLTEACHAGAHRAVAGQHSMQTGLSVEAAAQHDQIGLDFTQRLIIHAPGLHRSRWEVLNNDVGPVYKAQCGDARLGCSEIE